MKKVKIDFVNFGEKFDKKNNEFYHILSKKYDVEISQNPEYIIYYPFGMKHLEYDCVRIFWTAEQIVPDFNVCDYALGYEYMQYGDRYQRHNLVLNNNNMLQLLEHRELDVEEEFQKKKRFCNFLYGNVDGTNRKEFFHELCKYKKVDSCGYLLNNTGYHIGNTEEEKIEWQSNYKFTIAFENTSMPGYTTEKLLHAFAANTIPIYWGNTRCIEEYNTKAFINCNDYSNFEDVIETVKKIDNDDELYKKMLSEPVLIGDSIEKKNRDVEEFIFHIFDQDVSRAYRRNRGRTSPGVRVAVPLSYATEIIPLAYRKRYIGKRDILTLLGKVPGFLLRGRKNG